MVLKRTGSETTGSEPEEEHYQDEFDLGRSTEVYELGDEFEADETASRNANASEGYDDEEFETGSVKPDPTKAGQALKPPAQPQPAPSPVGVMVKGKKEGGSSKGGGSSSEGYEDDFEGASRHTGPRSAASSPQKPALNRNPQPGSQSSKSGKGTRASEEGYDEDFDEATASRVSVGGKAAAEHDLKAESYDEDFEGASRATPMKGGVGKEEEAADEAYEDEEFEASVKDVLEGRPPAAQVSCRSRVRALEG